MAAKKTAKSKNNTTATKNSKTKNSKKNAEKTVTVTINKKKVKTIQKRSSRYDDKGNRVQKQCSLCNKWLTLDNFYRPARDCRCKSCSSKYAKEQREANAA